MTTTEYTQDRLKALSELVQFALEELTARYRTAAHSAAQQVSA